MVVECPYRLMLNRTQLSGPRFPSLSLPVFNRLARILCPTSPGIARKWDYTSHLRTSQLKLSVNTKFRLLPVEALVVQSAFLTARRQIHQSRALSAGFP